MLLSLFSIPVSRSSISLSIRRLSSLLVAYWLGGLRGEGSGSMGVGESGSNGRLDAICVPSYNCLDLDGLYLKL